MRHSSIHHVKMKRIWCTCKPTKKKKKKNCQPTLQGESKSQKRPLITKVIKEELQRSIAHVGEISWQLILVMMRLL